MEFPLLVKSRDSSRLVSQGERTGRRLSDGPVSTLPGDYTVRLKGQKGPSQSATVRAKETTTVRF